jgi:polygalacturonase
VSPKAGKSIWLVLLALAASLALTAGARPAVSKPASQPRRCIITDFGAVANGQTVNTKAIQSAIDRCASDGGGVVVVPKGVFMSGALFFKPGVNLLVEKDAMLKGTTNLDDYPQVNTRWEGVERKWTSAFLNFENMTNVQVSGEGVIDGSGDLWMRRGRFGWRGRGGGTNSVPAGTNAPAVPQGVAVTTANISTNVSGTNTVPPRGRPRLICFSNCRNVRITGLRLQRQAVWCLHLLYCQNVVVDNLNIRAIERIPSSDGIDVDSCRDVKISRCDIACNDDDIAIKSGKDADGLRVNRPSENITISDCAIGSGGGITMGSEVSGSIRHVLVQRCTFTGTDSAARIKSQPSRGGVIEDITWRNIQLNRVYQAFEFNLAWRMVPPIVPPARVLTVVRNVRLVNFSGAARFGGVMRGLPDSPIQDVHFINCKVTARRGLFLENVKDPPVRPQPLVAPRYRSLQRGEDQGFSGLELKVAEGGPMIRGRTWQAGGGP